MSDRGSGGFGGSGGALLMLVVAYICLMGLVTCDVANAGELKNVSGVAAPRQGVRL